VPGGVKGREKREIEGCSITCVYVWRRHGGGRGCRGTAKARGKREEGGERRGEEERREKKTSHNKELGGNR
jgi:hypothetical protein